MAFPYWFAFKIEIYSLFMLKIAGFSDATHKFFPVFLSLSSNEDEWAFTTFIKIIHPYIAHVSHLLADADPAITIAAHRNTLTRLTCWFHCAKALKKRKPSPEIIKQIRILQRAKSEEEFFKGTNKIKFF